MDFTKMLINRFVFLNFKHYSFKNVFWKISKLALISDFITFEGAQIKSENKSQNGA